MRRVDACLEGRRHREDERERDAPVASREQPSRGLDDALAFCGELHAAIVAADTSNRVTRARDLSPHPAG
jgi:hypothetical protein